jgi:diazepam-binding inhibitor (GABA receptor modulator, acyl-CoA-binding protein)
MSELTLQEKFENAVADSKNLSSRPSNEVMLQLYSLYKQATEGDNTNEEPSNPFDFVGKAKYNAWSELKGQPKDLAMHCYVELVKKLKG